MRKILLIGTTVVLVADVAGKVQAKVSPQKAAMEVISRCRKEYPDIHRETFKRCINVYSFEHKSCDWVREEILKKGEYTPTKRVASIMKCSKPIQDESISAMLLLRYENMRPFPSKPDNWKDIEELFFSDTDIFNYLNKQVSKKYRHSSLPKPTVTQKDVDNHRRDWCTGIFRENGMPTQRVFDNCNRLFNKATYSLDFESKEERKEPASSVRENKTDFHNECLEARDYEGCIRAKTSGASRQSKDKCTETGICTVTAKGVDSFGFPKPLGWHYMESDDGRILYFKGPKRIPHNGEQARYIGFERITRYYQNPSAGSSGTYIGGNSQTTNCSGFGSSISCTTQGSSPTYIPGKQATPGGVRNVYFVNVFDCKDMTYASYKDGKVWIGWKDAKKVEPTEFQWVLQTYCKKGNPKSLDALNLKM